MRATIVAIDNVVLVNRIAQPVDCSELTADGIHAIQWYETHGEKEFVATFDEVKMAHDRKPNELFTDFSPYQKYVDEWEVSYKAAVLARAEQERQFREQTSPEGQAKMKLKFENDIRELIRGVLREEKLIK